MNECTGAQSTDDPAAALERDVCKIEIWRDLPCSRACKQHIAIVSHGRASAVTFAFRTSYSNSGRKMYCKPTNVDVVPKHFTKNNIWRRENWVSSESSAPTPDHKLIRHSPQLIDIVILAQRCSIYSQRFWGALNWSQGLARPTF